jgi:hypothetical protein
VKEKKSPRRQAAFRSDGAFYAGRVKIANFRERG